MTITTRSYLTAGVAALGVGAIALTPIQPIPNQVALAPQKAVSSLSVELAAAINPIQPWVDTFKAALSNTGDLFKDWQAGLYVDGVFPYPENSVLNGQLGSRTGGYASGEPFPFLKQVLANQLSYLNQLPAIGAIVKQMIGNVGNAVRAPFTVGETKPGTVLGIPGQYNQNINGVIFSNPPIPGLVINQRTVGALLPVLAPVEYVALKPILDFATTPISGLLVGAIGPVLGPVLSVVNSVQAIVTAIKAGQWTTAINETINIPAKMANAFLNGGPTLDLTKLASSLLPPEVTKLGVKMGGLLSPGGVAFDAVAADAGIPGVATISAAGLPVGPIGAFSALTNHVANAVKPPQQAGASVKRVKAAASTEAAAAEVAGTSDEAPAPKRNQIARANRTAHSASARAERTPRGAAARHAG